MNNEWLEVVIVRHYLNSDKIYLFEAPAFSGLKKGDIVLCRTANGVKQGTVVHTDDVEKDSASFQMWVDITNAKLPLKRIDGVFNKCSYKDEQGGDADNGNQL